MREYYDNWRTDGYDCGACKWHGVGSSLTQGDLKDDYFEILCPTCSEIVDLVMLPTIEESRANWDKLSEAERQQVEEMERLKDDFETSRLTPTSPLPEIQSPSFILHWDFLHDGFDSKTLICHGDTVIFTEPVIYEGYERFIEVAEILRAHYGPALRDLIPTDASETYLYGDRFSAPDMVEDARKRIFSQPPENT